MFGDIIKDERFAHIKTDPRFRHMPKSERKVKIDKRFHGMFQDKRFKEKYTVDKRGRKVNLTTSEDLKKFYELSESEEETEERKIKVKRKKVQKDTNGEIKSLKKTKDVRKDKLKNKAKESQKVKVKGGVQKSSLKPKDEEPRSTKSKPSVRKKKAITRDDDDDDEDDGDKTESSEEEEESDESVGGESGDSDSIDEDDDDNEDDDDDDEGDDDDDDDEEEEIDFARGDGNIPSSSDSDDDEEFTFDQQIDVEHKWGELDAEAETTDDITSRLALCNMDWDRIKAQDLLVLFNSFKPTGGIIKSIKIFLSEFGKERVKEEDVKGPKELVEDERDTYRQLGEEEGEKYHTEKLRQYQMNRLKYYYAVIECDSNNTANAIYEECDGLEYQNSSTRLDLRFIPDHVAFEDEPTSVATDIPDSYKPSEFMTSALQQTKVDLTWDETDKDRLAVTTKKFSKDEVMELDVQAYLASSSDEEDAKKIALPEIASDSDGSDDVNDEDRIAKYRELLKGADDKEEKFDKDMEMEITWEPGLKETTEELVKKKEEGEDLTPWEQYQKKKKAKKREQKTAEKKKREEIKKQRGEAVSDDDLPADVDLDDPYFKEVLEEGESRKPADSKQKKKKKKKKGQVEEMTAQELEEKKQKEAELELLLMDEDDDKQHFSLKAIMDAEKEAKRKKKKKKRKHEEEETFQDKFQVDTQDPRFSAIFDSHHFQIDPSDPQFKKTNAMETIIQEKQKRRKRKEAGKGTGEMREENRTSEGKQRRDASLSMLVKSVKNKTDQFHARKQKKLKLH